MNPWRSLNFPIELNHVISHLNHWTRHCNGLIWPHQEIPSNQFFICQSYRFLKNKQLGESQILIDSQHSKDFLQTFSSQYVTRNFKQKLSTRHSPFYSATSIFAVLRNLVREIWFEKSGSRKVVDQKKGGVIPLIHIFSGSRKVVDPEYKGWSTL